jgi:hypothetical protein
MTSVQLPDGCYGLDMANGKQYTAGPGGRVDVDAADAKFIGTSFYGQSGIMRGGPQFSIGTKTGRWCAACKRAWQNWSASCPRCGADTTLMEACGSRIRNE